MGVRWWTDSQKNKTIYNQMNIDIWVNWSLTLQVFKASTRALFWHKILTHSVSVKEVATQKLELQSQVNHFKTKLVTLDHKLHSCSVVTAMWFAAKHDSTISIHVDVQVEKLSEHMQYMKKVNASSNWNIPLDIVQVSVWLTSQVPDNNLWWSLKSVKHNLCRQDKVIVLCH